MNISNLIADDAILAEVGVRIARYRLDLQLTQAELAEQAGIGKRTVERVEAGASAQMLSIIRILRVLELLPNLERMLPAAEPKPMDMLKRKGKMRQRASKSQSSDQSGEVWSWDDE